MNITKIISGGQTGADRGALDAAIQLGIPHGGWCPKGRWAEDGPIPPRYALRETEMPDTEKRTEANVIEADATLIFTDGPLAGGSLHTAEFAARLRRPHLHLDLRDIPDPDASRDAILALMPRLCSWLDSLPGGAGVLNVAGSRESEAPGLQGRVAELVSELLRAKGPRTFHSW